MNLILTPNHKLWTRFVKNSAWAKNHSRKEAIKKQPEWIEAKDTLGSYINAKLPPIEKPNIESLDHWWIVGRWLADGHFDSRGGVVLSCGDHEVEMLKNRLGAYGGNPFHGEGSAKQILLHDKDKVLRETLSRCGIYAHGKHLPSEAYTLHVPQAKALLEGYLSGDGHFVSKRNTWNTSSVSKELLLGISLLVQRVYGAIASLYPGRQGGSDEILGRAVNTKQEWILCFDIPNSKRPKGMPFILDDGAWKKVRSIDLIEEPVETWCLKVDEDESFYAEGCIVKNCPMQFDIADRVIEQMSSPGDIVYDPFGGLMTVPLRAILKGRYGIGHELNPQYFLDGATHLKAAEYKISVPTLFDFVDEKINVPA